MNLKVNWDALGVTASVACAIHCAVLPLLLSSLPILGFDIIQNAFFEYLMIGLAFLIGTYSLSRGYRKQHHRVLPLALFSAGIVLLVLKQVYHNYHIWFLFLAVLAIVSAHFFNFRFCKVLNHAHSDDCDH